MGIIPKAGRSRKADTNLPLFALLCAAAVTAEAITFRLLWVYESDHLVAVLYSLLTVTFALAGIVISAVAARRKSDPRPAERRKAGAAVVVSWLLILPSSFIGGGAMALKIQDRAALEFAGSEAYRQTLALSKESTDERVRAQAALDLERAIRPTQARMGDPAYLGGVLSFLTIMALPLIAAANGMASAPETATERKRREAAVRARKAALTREANAKEKARLDRKVRNAARKGAPFRLVEAVRN